MVNITGTADNEKYIFKALGHAEYAPRGQPDIVCAAVSALITTLAESMLQEGLADAKDVKLQFGDNCVMFKKCDKSLKILKIIEYGINLLIEKYPDNVSYDFI